MRAHPIGSLAKNMCLVPRKKDRSRGQSRQQQAESKRPAPIPTHFSFFSRVVNDMSRDTAPLHYFLRGFALTRGGPHPLADEIYVYINSQHVYAKSATPDDPRDLHD